MVYLSLGMIVLLFEELLRKIPEKRIQSLSLFFFVGRFLANHDGESPSTVVPNGGLDALGVIHQFVQVRYLPIAGQVKLDQFVTCQMILLPIAVVSKLADAAPNLR